MDPYEVSTLKKGLLVLNALQVEGNMTLCEIKDMLALNKSTTYRLLYTLEKMGYIEKIHNVYSVTNKIGIKPNPYHTRINWLSVPPLFELSAEIGETAYIGVLRGTNVVTAQVVDSTCSSHARTNVGQSDPIHVSALGKAIISFLEESEKEKIIHHLKLVQNTKFTFNDHHLLKEHLKIIKQQGYAIDDEEAEIGLRCVAAPIFAGKHVIASIAIAGSSSRLPKRGDKAISRRLMQCSKEISKMIQ